MSGFFQSSRNSTVDALLGIAGKPPCSQFLPKYVKGPPRPLRVSNYPKVII